MKIRSENKLLVQVSYDSIAISYDSQSNQIVLEKDTGISKFTNRIDLEKFNIVIEQDEKEERALKLINALANIFGEFHDKEHEYDDI